MSSLFIVLIALTFPGSELDQRHFKHHTGNNVTLTFQTPSSSLSVWLNRKGSDKYIVYCKDGHPMKPADQEPSFKDRVEWIDCKRITGNVSVTLTNLSRNDRGTYEFHVITSNRSESNETITLTVTDPETPLLHITWILVIPVIGAILLALSYKERRKNLKPSLDDPECVKVPLDDAAD